MIGVSDRILNYAASLQQFSVDDIPADVLSDVERNTLSWHLSNLCKKGKLRRVGRGVYTLQSANTFIVKANAKARSLYRSLSGQYPFADFCVYCANVITPLLHDMMPNNTLYVETNRDTTQSVFDMLSPKYNGHIFLAPTKEIATTYIDFSKENIIVKPLVTEAPLTLDGKVPVPTLEKLLVDTRVDADFYYLQGYENLEMLRTAISHYDVNQTRLLRYADRRNAKDSIQKDLETIKNHDTERML
jgi:predicted transcriptional regulator of viral defense system